MVEPEVVGVELCKDRLPLLVNTESDNTPNLWHCRKVGGQCKEARAVLSEWHQCQLGTVVFI